MVTWTHTRVNVNAALLQVKGGSPKANRTLLFTGHMLFLSLNQQHQALTVSDVH